MIHPATDRRLAQHIADQMFSRAAGAPLVGGNAVRVLRDAAENYPAWAAAIAGAGVAVDVEMYIFRRDAVGRRFVALLAERARAGVRVRVLYDWFGAGLSAATGLFAPLTRAGGVVRPANPPSARAPLRWLSRDHRKLIVVDDRVAFVSGLGIAAEWAGDPAAGREPWRDTGVEIVGPAVADAAAAFAASWRRAGGDAPPRAVPAAARAGPSLAPAAGGAPGAPGAVDAPAAPVPDAPVRVRLVATEPFAANLLRMDLLIAALARRTLWITDAYFVGTGSYVDALRRAAEDGVDVRLLLPRNSDVGWTVPLSRALYRPLLESGVRLFEWQGAMIHAKTAVADGRWSRIGSTNLNLNGWVGNWELDVAVEDDGVGSTLEDHYRADLARSTEIFAAHPRSARRWRPRVTLGRRDGPRRAGPRRTGQLARSATRLGTALGDVVVGRRAVESLETAPLVGLGLALVAAGAVFAVAPRLLAWPVALVAAWVGLAMLVDALALWRRRR